MMAPGGDLHGLMLANNVQKLCMPFCNFSTSGVSIFVGLGMQLVLDQ